MFDSLKEISYPDFIPIDRDLCRKCGAECCDSSTPFTRDDIAAIKQKHRKLLRGVEIKPIGSMAYNLFKRGNESCVFLDGEKKCKVYDVRPQICRDFGDKPWCLCAYNGLSDIPTDVVELAQLASNAQRINAERLAAGVGVKLKVNMINPDMSSVLSDQYKKNILDFRKKD